MSIPKLTLIVAVSENGVIGKELDMPWKLSTDLKRFKSVTMGKPLIMGRKTFVSVGERPLPGRPHFIISRNNEYKPDGVTVVGSLEEAIRLANVKASEHGVDEVFVAGGGEIYKMAMPLADQLFVTHVDASLEGDTIFPEIDLSIFTKTDEMSAPAGEKDDFPVRFATYTRN